jgi:gliding motility-associated-like protein
LNKIKYIAAGIFIYLTLCGLGFAQTSITYNWSGFPDGGTNYSNTQAGGCTMTASVSGTQFNAANIPRYTGTGTLPGANNGKNGLFLDQNWTNTSTTTTVTINFSPGITNPCFNVYDINRNGPCAAFCSSSWNDKVVISTGSGTVSVSSANPSEHNITGNGSSSVTIDGKLVCNGTNADVQVCLSGTITSLTITYGGSASDRTSGSGSCGGDPSGCFNNRVNCPDPGRQYITIGNISGSSCCSGAGNSAPSAVTGNSGPFCPGTSTTLTATGGNANTQWFTGGCNGSNIGSGTSITVAPTTTTTYYAANKKCDGSLTACAQITVNVANVNPAWTPPNPVCAASSAINLNTLITGTTGGTFSGSGVSSNSFNPSGLTGTVPITYTVSSGGCTKTESHNITVIADVNPAWTAPADFCSNDASINLNTLITGTAGGTWSGTGVSGSTFNPSGLNGTYNITYTVGTNPCAETLTKPITVVPSASAQWNTVHLCSTDAPLNLNTLLTGTSGGNWSGSGVSGSTFNPAGLNGNISITYAVGTSPCNDALTQNITVSAGSNAAWTSPSPLCAADGSIDLSALITGTTGGTFTGNGVSGNTFDPSGLNGNIAITYTVGSGQCVNTLTHNVNVSPVGNPAWNPFTVCSDNSNVNLDTTVVGLSGGTWSGSGVSGNTFNPSGLSGNIALTYNVGSGSCTSTLTQNITVITSPNASWNSDTVCFNQSPLNLNSLVTGTAGGTFTGNGVNNNNFNPNGLSDNIALTYTVNNNGCIKTETRNITIIEPFLNLNGDLTKCEGDTISLNAISNGTVNWSGPGSFSSNQNSPVIFNSTIANSGNYIVTSALLGCIKRDTVSVLINPLPIINLLNNSPVCAGNTTTLSTTILNGASYNWQGPNSSSSSVLTILNTQPTDTGVYTINVSLNGCLNSDSTRVSITPKTIATLTPVNPLCTNSGSVNLQASINGGTWIGSGVSATSFNPSIAGPGIFTISYLLNQTCTDTSKINITVNPVPSIQINNPDTLCEGSSIQLSSNLNNNYNYNWQFNGISVSNSNTVNVNNASTSNQGWYILTATQNNCNSKDSVFLIIKPKINLTITPAGPFCTSSSTINLIASAGGGIWGGNGIINNTNGLFSPNTAGDGTHTISYGISKLCGDTAFTNILVIKSANAAIKPHAPFCANDLPDNILSLEPNGTWSGNGIINPGTGLFNPGNAGVGQHIITYNINSVCGSTDTVVITVKPMISSTITPPPPYCETDGVDTLLAASPGGVWNGNGITNPVIGIFNPSSVGVGNYPVTYTISQQCGTSSTDTIRVFGNPKILVTANPEQGCAPLSVSINNAFQVSNSSCEWYVNGNLVSGNCNTLNYTFNQPGCNNISYQVTDNNGCKAQGAYNGQICVTENPIADFNYSPKELSIFTPNVTFYNNSQNATQYSWDFAGLGGSNEVNPSYLFNVPTDGDYLVCLEAENDIGCIDTACVKLYIEGEFSLYIPNAFTPNNDGRNEKFKPIIKGFDEENYNWYIFDRWGLQIYQTENENDGWNGKYMEKEAPIDTYVWRLKTKNKYSGKPIDLTGTFTLVR